MIYNCISPTLFASQSFDQHAFTPGIRIEDALLCVEVAMEQFQEYNTPIWLLSMDMRKAFDTVEHSAMFQALKEHGVHDSYTELIGALYTCQTGSANGSETFAIQRGEKQGDLMS